MNIDPQHNAQGDDWEDRLVDYVFGALPPDEAARFELSLEECRRHVTLARQYTEVVGWLGASVPPAEPPEGHKARMMARIASTPRRPTRTAGEAEDGGSAPGLAPAQSDLRSVTPPTQAATVSELRARHRGELPRYAWWAGAGAVVAAGLLLLLGYFIGALQTRGGIVREGVVAVPVHGQGDMAQATGVILFDPNSRETVLVASGLKPLPPDRVYELWLLPPEQGAAPVPAGVFTPDPTGKARHTVLAPSEMKDYAGVAVTVERGLVARPEGPVVMQGQYQVP
jgi:anti-sigma-K factor RskA